MEIKEHISTIIAVALVLLVMMNVNSILNYREPEMPTLQEEEEYYFDIEKMPEDTRDYSSLISIEEYNQGSGDLTMAELSFSPPDLLKEEDLKEGDNKKIYFFGKVDPNTEQPVEEWESDSGSDKGWESWANESKGGEVSNTVSPEGDHTEEGPMEVTFDRFIGNNKDKIEGENE